MPRNGLRKNPKKRISGIPASALRKPLVTTTCDANQDDGVFSHEQELALKKYLQQSAKLYSGLTSKTARELAFKYALKLQKAQVLKKMPSNWCLNKMTGEDWLNEYLKRHPDLSFEWPQTPLENAVNKRILASQGDGVFSPEQELALKKYLKTSAKIFWGLTSKTARRLAFEYALKLQKAEALKNMPSNWRLKKIAGEDWLNKYLKRHPDLSLERQ